MNAANMLDKYDWREWEGCEFPSNFSDTACRIVRDQYFRDGETSFKDVLIRVIETIAKGHTVSSLPAEAQEAWACALVAMLIGQRASFNSPVWYNFGVNDYPQGSACFIQPVDDTMESIMQLATNEAMLFKHGSGTGTNLSNLRGKNERLSKSDGKASGPVTFMRMYDAVAGVVKSGGRTRRAAKMQLLDDDHPDLMDFIWCKADEEARAKSLAASGLSADDARKAVSLQNLNHSVRLSDSFMERATAAEQDVRAEKWDLVDRVSGMRNEMDIAPADILYQIAEAAWECGDPGVQFMDTINSHNMVPHVGPIRASNPCSEFVFVDNSACNLASLNADKYIDAECGVMCPLIDHDVRALVWAMDAIVDVSGYPTGEIRGNSVALRPLGIGFTNIGAALMRRGIRYGSPESVKVVGELAKAINDSAAYASAHLAARLGAFDGYDAHTAERILSGQGISATTLAAVKRHGLRNAQLTLVAPTGTISFMMDCESTGIEPVLAEHTVKKLENGEFVEATPSCVADARHMGAEDAVVTAIGANRVSTEDHLLILGVVQTYVSGAISKTINLPKEATVSDIVDVFEEAWARGIKCISVYRDGSKVYQPVTNADSEAVPDAAMCVRRKLPDNRLSETHKFAFGGVEGYLHVGLYDDGTPGELFVHVAKDGSTASGLMDAWATTFSLLLQCGFSLEHLVEKFKGTKFEPAGFTSNADIPLCSSLADYVVRWMEQRFLQEGQAHSMDVSNLMEREEWGGEVCPDCGAPVFQTGTCKTCRECGWGGGCG